jgi:hypothetical protein
MLAHRNRLNPSHSQIRRIVTAGHIVLLCREANEMHHQHAAESLGIVHQLLVCHVDSWPEATRLIDAFRAASALLGEGFLSRRLTADIHYDTVFEQSSQAAEPYLNSYDMPLPMWRPWEADLLSQILGGEGVNVPEEVVVEINGISPVSPTLL